jgi:hypothetical protein
VVEDYNQFVTYNAYYAARRKHDELNPSVTQKASISKEVISMISPDQMDALRPISEAEIKTLPRYFTARTITVLKEKKNNDLSTAKLKARTNLRGDLLKKMYKQLGSEPSESFSPTIHPLTFAILLQLSVIYKLKRKSFDISSAFLTTTYPSSETPIIVKLEDNVAHIAGLDPAQRYRVNKYIYGLADASRAFYLAYAGLLVDNGYTCSKLDPCLFYRHDPLHGEMYILVHVDDTYALYADEAAWDRLVAITQTKYSITSDDEGSSFLGTQLETLPDGSIKLTQPKLLDKLFKEYLQHQPKAPTSPHRRPLAERDYDPTPVSTTQYLALLGLLMYITKSRPDISTATSFGSTKCSYPTQTDYDDLLHCVEYLHATRTDGLILYPHSGNPLKLICTVDASYLIHPDSKSHTGYTISFGTVGSCYSKSSKQSLVSTSSTHAEMRAVFTLIKDIIFVIALCDEIGHPIELPAIIFEDNAAVIDMAMDEATKLRKCKHFLMLINYVKEQVAMGLVELHHIDTTLNPSDLLSKPIYGQDQQHKSQAILGQQPGQPYLPPIHNPKSPSGSSYTLGSAPHREPGSAPNREPGSAPHREPQFSSLK